MIMMTKGMYSSKTTEWATPQIKPAEKYHDDFLMAHVYAWATKVAEFKDSYVRMHIRQKPRWCPEFLYRWFLGKFLVLSEFKI